MHDSACSLHIRAERDAWSAVQHRVSGCRNATSLGAAGGAVSRVVVCAMVEVGWRAPGKSSRILIRRAFARRATCCSLRFSASDGITASRRRLGEAPAKPHTVVVVVLVHTFAYTPTACPTILGRRQPHIAHKGALAVPAVSPVTALPHATGTPNRGHAEGADHAAIGTVAARDDLSSDRC